MENLKLRGLRNTRDLGGIVATAGTVRAKALLRGGHLHDIPPKTAAALADDYGVKLVIDLRTDIEQREKPDLTVPGAMHRSIPLLDAATVGITHEEGLDDKAALLSRLPDIEQLYRNMVAKTGASRLAEVVEACMTTVVEGGAALFHCTEGKDRTGVTALVLLSALGVPQDAILRDYLFTNTVAKKRARQYYRMVLLLKRDKALAAKIRTLFLAEESYLRAAIDAIESEWGSVNAFTTEALGINPDLQAAFAACALIS